MNCRAWLINHWRAVLFGVLPMLAIGWLCTAYPRGMIAAHWDVSQGTYVVLTSGYPDRSNYRHIIRDRYGVTVRSVAGCEMTPFNLHVFWFADGYNDAAMPRIRAVFGKDIFAECRDAANAERRAADAN